MRKRSAGLRIVTRPDTGALTIVGTVAGRRVRRRAQSNDRHLAREEAATIEAEILRTAWHGERRGTRTFAEAVKEYVAAAPRTKNTKYRLNRLLLALGPDMTLGGINQETVNRLKVKLLPDAAPATVKRSIVTPLRAVLWYAKRQGWCDAPLFERLKDSDKKRTNYLLPQQATRLIMSANPALRVLIVFLLCTGARLAEALELDWRDVDLAGGRAIFWKTQNGKRRNARLPPRIVTVLRDLPHREGAVIRRPDGQPYTDLNREGGNQVHTAWRNARRHAGIDPKLRMHDLRHTWASWYYAVHRDLLELQVEGGWSSIVLVTRYAHLLPHGHEREIEAFWHGNDTAIQPTRLSA